MPFQQLQQLPDWPIMRNRVWHRHNRLEPKHTLFIAVHHASSIGALAIAVLYVIMAGAVCLPDIDLDPFDRVSLNVFNGTDNETWLAFGIMGNQLAVRDCLCFMRVEGSEDRTFSGSRRFGVVNCVDEEGKT